MNGYVVFKKEYIGRIISDYIIGEPDPQFVRKGAYQYVNEIYNLNKPVLITDDRVRGTAQLICNVYDADRPFILVMDFGFGKSQTTITKDDYFRSVYTNNGG